LNGVQIDARNDNVFDFLTAQIEQASQYDLIVLDPPSFAKSRESLNSAWRGYKEIHLRALQLLSDEGLLVTFFLFPSCIATDADRSCGRSEHRCQTAFANDKITRTTVGSPDPTAPAGNRVSERLHFSAYARKIGAAPVICHCLRPVIPLGYWLLI